jgi:hypothetical protein
MLCNRPVGESLSCRNFASLHRGQGAQFARQQHRWFSALCCQSAILFVSVIETISIGKQTV